MTRGGLPGWPFKALNQPHAEFTRGTVGTLGLLLRNASDVGDVGLNLFAGIVEGRIAAKGVQHARAGKAGHCASTTEHSNCGCQF